MYGTLVPALWVRRAIYILRDLERTSKYSKGAGEQVKYFGVSGSKQLRETLPLCKKKKNGQDLAQTSRKWQKKFANGESDGERKIYPSANPEYHIFSYLKPV